ncbi:uncharacterized protein C1orf158 homolog [Hypomesus transpacificus]|uniref:uncharacterized protein C1orf158 homolog n=1 Tax=Hypomesus transpacificus TaxID=137520 RepID=UPI001F085565|nr:uncharacterized protein C1orf158 homolog [Hypomesus transpacificus]
MGKREPYCDKWSLPGWRIEQKYGNKVLIGNWVEEKLQFSRECQTANSTSRSDYQPHWNHRPDVFLRRSALRRAEGLPSKLLLSHHGIPNSHCLVTLYDEAYARMPGAALPALRSWHPDKMAWAPERSDEPAVAPPTNFGLARSRRLHLEQQREPLPALSVYASSYQRLPASAFPQRASASAPRGLSSRLYPANNHNKDLELRQQPSRLVPDSYPSLGLLPSLGRA